MTPGPGVNPAAPEVTIAPADRHCGAGVGIVLEVQVRHPGPQPAQLTVMVHGLDPGWVPAPMMIALQPGEVTTIALTIRPEPGALSASYPFVVAVESLDPLGTAGPVMSTAESTLAVGSRERADAGRRPGAGHRCVRPQGSAPDHQSFPAETASCPCNPHVPQGISLRLEHDVVDVPAGRTVGVRGQCSGPQAAAVRDQRGAHLCHRGPRPGRAGRRRGRPCGPGRCSAARWSGQSRWCSSSRSGSVWRSSPSRGSRPTSPGIPVTRPGPVAPALMPVRLRAPTAQQALMASQEPTAPQVPMASRVPMAQPGADGAPEPLPPAKASAAWSPARIRRGHGHPRANQPDRGRRGRRAGSSGRHRRGHRVRPAGRDRGVRQGSVHRAAADQSR